MKTLIKKVITAIILINFTIVFNASADMVKCNSLPSTNNGDIANLLSGTPCVVDDDDEFTWTAWDGSVNNFIYDYEVELGSESLTDVANVLGFLTDLGFFEGDTVNGQYNGSYDFYADDGIFVGTFSHLGASDDGYGTGADDDEMSGDWTTPDGASFMTVKAANSFVLYYFDPAATSGDWSTYGILNNGGQRPGLSHINWWQADGGFVTQQCIECEPIPEPQNLLILSAALLGLFINRRKLFK